MGIAGVDDLRGIANPEARAVCERRALRLARKLLVEEAPQDIDAVIAAADEERRDGHEPYVPM